jgi:Fic family protein
MRREYYAALGEVTGRASTDVTSWLAWFCSQLKAALESSEKNLLYHRLRSAFMERAASLSSAQKAALDRMLDNRTPVLTPKEFAGLPAPERTLDAGDIADLVERGFLRAKQGRLELGDDGILSVLKEMA